MKVLHDFLQDDRSRRAESFEVLPEEIRAGKKILWYLEMGQKKAYSKSRHSPRYSQKIQKSSKPLGNDGNPRF